MLQLLCCTRVSLGVVQDRKVTVPVKSQLFICSLLTVAIQLQRFFDCYYINHPRIHTIHMMCFDQHIIVFSIESTHDADFLYLCIQAHVEN
jgi:hypothetical protein